MEEVRTGSPKELRYFFQLTRNAAFLLDFEVPALLPGQVYFGPQLGFGNPCTCSTVTYSMAMACGACQGAGINKFVPLF